MWRIGKVVMGREPRNMGEKLSAGILGMQQRMKE
jgi:hypothetical protein